MKNDRIENAHDQTPLSHIPKKKTNLMRRINHHKRLDSLLLLIVLRIQKITRLMLFKH